MESLGQAHLQQTAAHAAQARELVQTHGAATAASRAVVVRDEADASEARAQYEACEASLRTMLALESSRLRDVRAEVRRARLQKKNSTGQRAERKGHPEGKRGPRAPAWRQRHM